MGATKTVLWALVLVATADLLVAKHVTGGQPVEADRVKQVIVHPERNVTADAHPDMVPAKAFAQKRP